MIKINLLPKEMQVNEKTPLPRIITIYLSVAICSALGLYIFNIKSIIIPKKEAEKTDMQNRITLLEPELKIFNELTAQKKRFMLREKTVNELLASRMSIEEVLDQLCTLIDSSNVWLSRLTLAKPMAKGRRARPTPAQKGKNVTPAMSMTFECSIISQEKDLLDLVADFFKRFKTDPYWKVAVTPPPFEGVKIKENTGTFKVTTSLINKNTKKPKRPLRAPVKKPVVKR